MPDIAQLAIQARTEGVAESTTQLASLSRQADATERSVQTMGAAATRVTPHVQNMNRALEAQQRQMRATQMAGVGLTWQFSDIGVSLASGMPVWQVALQQGSQLQDQFALMRAEGVKTSAALRGVATGFVPIIGVTARLSLILAPLALAWAAFERQVSKGVPADVTRGLGLTADQLKKVEDRTVTMGDTFMATLDVIGERISSGPISNAMDWLGDQWNATLDDLATNTANEIASIIAFFGAGYAAAVAVWQNFPAVFSDLIVTGANAALKGIEWFVNKAVEGINSLLPALKGLAGSNPLLSWIHAIDEIQTVSFEPFKNEAAGAAAAVGEVFTTEFSRIRAEALAEMNSLLDDIRDRAVSRAVERALEQAGEAGAGRRDRSGKSALEKQIEDTLRFIASLKEQAETFGMNAIAAKQYEIAQEALRAPTAELRIEIERYGEALLEKMRVEASGVRQMRDQLELVEAETRLVAAGNRERAIEIALIQQRQAMREQGLTPGMVEWTDGENAARALAGAQVDATEAAVAHNYALEFQLDLLTQIDGRAQSMAQGLTSAFGQVGTALGDVMTIMSSYAARQQEIADAEARYRREVGETGVDERRIALFRQAAADAEIEQQGALIAAVKSGFSERSAAYKGLTLLEQAFRAIEFANAAKSVAMATWETAQKIPQFLAQGAAAAAAGAARMFQTLGPLGFAAVAAMGATLAAFGLRSMGGGGSGSFVVPATNSGQGTVLGDPTAESESITRSLEMAERYQNKDLEHGSETVTALRAIQTNIGGLVTAISRQVGIGGAFDESRLALGTTSRSGFLGIGGSTTTRELTGQGVTLNGGALADLIAGGVNGAFYQLVTSTRTSNGFLGIGGGTRTSTSETTTGLDGETSRQLARVLASLRDGVLTAAGELGVTGAEAVLDTFRVSLGRISFDGLSSSEISERLNAVFSAVGDDMAAAILPGLSAFQRAGEGLFETLSRLATEYRTVDLTLASIGMTFRTVGLESIEARTRLIELSGGLEAFVDGAAFFAENFLTDAQRIAPIQAAVAAELERLGIASDITREGFASLVMGLDVSTEAGAAMYAALIALAPALDQVLRYQEDLAGSITNTAELDRQRRTLEIALMEAQGDAAGALAARRADELARMDASLRPLQEAIWAAEDMARAAAELAEAERQAAEAQRVLAQQRRDLEIQLMEATGDAAGALAARRQLELAALDESLRPLQEAIWAALDLAAANEALAQAQADAAAAAEAEAQRLAQLDASRRNLEIDLLDAQGRSAEAVAARRALELEALDASLRPLQEAIYAALDLAAAAETLAEAERQATEAAQAEAERLAQIANQRRSLEIQLLEATGDAAGALAARRADELAALDASLRPLQEAVWAALDLAEANRQLAEAQSRAAEEARQEAERLAAIARQQRELDIQLLEATGDSSAALAARRQDELAALDESLRATQLSIWAALDLAAANELAAVAQQEAAEAAARLAEQRRGLEIELLEATGDAAGALAARRADELAALDESLRSIQLAIWAALDLAAANEAAAAAQREAADVANRLAAQRSSLEIELLEATGRSVQALARRRQQELDQLDESLRPIQLQIYAAQDLAEAQARAAEEQAAAARAAEEAARAYAEMQQDAINRVEQARSALSEAYQREAGALRDTIDTFRDFGASIRAFRAGLDTAEGAGGSYAASRTAFEQTAVLARLGNQEALGNLTGASQTFLDAALSNASSASAYNRDVGLVKSALDAAAGTADRNVSVAEQQLAALDASVSGLITLNESVLSVADGISALQAAILDARRFGVTQFAQGGVFTSPTLFQMGGSLGQLAEAGPEAIMPLVSGPDGLGVRATGPKDDEDLRAAVQALTSEVAMLRAEAAKTARSTQKTADLLVRVTRDGEAVLTEAA